MAIKLTKVQEKFILHWGEMGTRWGINRTVAQIHALLYIHPEPLNAEEIAATLSVARSNVSTSLRELQGWGIIKVVHLLGDRRDHYESMKDVWEMFRVIVAERKRREVDPTVEIIQECLADAEKMKGSEAQYAKERLQEMQDFMSLTTTWYEGTSKWPTQTLIKFIKLGDKAFKILKLG